MKANVIVIVGGGAIGLCIAYCLATEYGKKVEVYVLEALPGTFQATSDSSTGCLHFAYDTEQEDLVPLGYYSFELWKQVSKRNGFMNKTGYTPCSFFFAQHGYGNCQDGVPNWIILDRDWDISKSMLGHETATINPVKLGEWLSEECRKHGVQIKTGATVTKARLSKAGEITQIEYSSEDGTTSLLCDSLVLAAGPWSPSVLQGLFPEMTLDLGSRPVAADWIVFKNPQMLDISSIGVVFLDEIVGHKLEFTGRNDGTIWLCGKKVYDSELCPVGEHAQADGAMIKELRTYANRFINTAGSPDGQITLLHCGRSFRPSRTSEIPIISELPVDKLLPGANSKSKSGVFLCWGHGSWGVSLGMGSGRLMAQLVQRERPDIDLSKFTI